MAISTLVWPIAIRADVGRCSWPRIDWFKLIWPGRRLLSRIIKIDTGRIAGHWNDQSDKAGGINIRHRQRGAGLVSSLGSLSFLFLCFLFFVFGFFGGWG